MKGIRARGFFAAFDSQPYQPRGIVLGQETEDSCVAACCRMLLFDQLSGIASDFRYSESFLREALETDSSGSVIAKIPALLKQYSATRPYVYRKALTIAELRKITARHPAIAFVPTRAEDDFHALMVDVVSADSVAIRDPLPEGRGAAYTVALPVFEARWLSRENGCGRAVTVLE